MSMAACLDALDNTSAQDKTCGWAAHCSEYLFISIVENKDDLLMFFFTEFNLQMYLVNTIYKSGIDQRVLCRPYLSQAKWTGC